MTQHEIMRELAEIIEETKTGVLATVDRDGRPHLRWMTPAVLKDRQTALFAVTCPRFSKTTHLAANPKVEWMVQSKQLNKIIHVRGIVNLLDNPFLKSEVLEELGQRLTTFWQVNCEASEFVVVETVIQEVELYEPLKNHYETVKFR